MFNSLSELRDSILFHFERLEKDQRPPPPGSSSVSIIKSVLFGRNANKFTRALEQLLYCFTTDLQYLIFAQGGVGACFSSTRLSQAVAAVN